MQDLSVLAQKAASQHGLLSYEQLTGLVGSNALTSLRRLGIVKWRSQRVYQLVGSSPGWHTDLMAICLASERLVVASHRSASRLWGFRTVDDELEVSVRYPGKLRVDGAIVHRIRDLTEHDFTFIEGIPVTTPARTLCDAGLTFPQHEVERMVEHAVAQKIVKLAELSKFRWRVGRQGRNGAGVLDRVLSGMPPAAESAESGPEVRLAKICREAGLPTPSWQHPVAARGRQYRIDFAFPSARLAVEYDGYEEHNGISSFVQDRRRQNDLQEIGWTVIRFTWGDLRDRPAEVAQRIRTFLDL